MHSCIDEFRFPSALSGIFGWPIRKKSRLFIGCNNSGRQDRLACWYRRFKDENGKDISSDFEAQVRFIFGKLDKTLKEAGGNLQDMVEMTVYITDVANGASFANIRKEFFPSGNYPASTLVTISHLAFPGMVVEISGTAVIGDACSATAPCSK